MNTKKYIQPRTISLTLNTESLIAGSPNLEQKDETIENPDEVMTQRQQGNSIWDTWSN